MTTSDAPMGTYTVNVERVPASRLQPGDQIVAYVADVTELRDGGCVLVRVVLDESSIHDCDSTVERVVR